MLNFLKNNKVEKIYSPCDGQLVELSTVNDEVFSKGIVGNGFAVKPISNQIYAPIDGMITMVFDTKHAIGITSKKGQEIIIHVGIDTVKLKGECFKVLVKENQKIAKGDLLINVDFKNIIKKGYETDVLTIFTNSNRLQLDKLNSNVKSKEEVGLCE